MTDNIKFPPMPESYGYDQEDMEAYALEAVRLNAQAMPDGWVLVPKDPTPEMLGAGLRYVEGMASMPTAYRAMLSAAPAAPQPAQPLTDDQEKAGRWEWIEANCLSVIDLAGNRICASATEIDLVRRKP